MAFASKTFSVTATSFAAAGAKPATPDLDTGRDITGMEMFLTSASVLGFSFDGINEHGRLDSTNYKSTQRQFSQKPPGKVWLRVVSGTSPATGTLSVW